MEDIHIASKQRSPDAAAAKALKTKFYSASLDEAGFSLFQFLLRKSPHPQSKSSQWLLRFWLNPLSLATGTVSTRAVESGRRPSALPRATGSRANKQQRPTMSLSRFLLTSLLRYSVSSATSTNTWTLRPISSRSCFLNLHVGHRPCPICHDGPNWPCATSASRLTERYCCRHDQVPSRHRSRHDGRRSSARLHDYRALLPVRQLRAGQNITVRPAHRSGLRGRQHRQVRKGRGLVALEVTVTQWLTLALSAGSGTGTTMAFLCPTRPV